MEKKKSNLSILLEKEKGKEKKERKEKKEKEEINSYSSEEDFEEQQNIRVYNLDNLRIHQISKLKDINSLEKVLHSYFNEKDFIQEKIERYKNDFSNYFKNILIKFRPDIIKKELLITKKKNEAKSEPIIIPGTSVDTPDRKNERNKTINKLSKNTKKKPLIPFPKMDKGGAKTKRKNVFFKFSKKKKYKNKTSKKKEKKNTKKIIQLNIYLLQ